jgi:phosphatidylserine synthase 2
MCSSTQGYTWRGFRQTRGIRSKGKRVLTQFSPHDWTTFRWEGTASLRNYLAVLALLACFLAAELNPFYLKVIHPFFVWRSALLSYRHLVFALDGTGSPFRHYALGWRFSMRPTSGSRIIPIREQSKVSQTRSFAPMTAKRKHLDRRTVRMGQHAWLLMATICTELLCILKWSKGQFAEPFPRYIKFFWSIGGTVLVAYPMIKVS